LKCFNKQVGISRLWYKSHYIRKFEAYVLFAFFSVFIWAVFFNYCIYALITELNVYQTLDNNNVEDPSGFVSLKRNFLKKLTKLFGLEQTPGMILPDIGFEHPKGLVIPDPESRLFDANLIDLDDMLKDRYADYFLFSYSSNGRFFYDGNENFLVVEKFHHSMFLEYLFAGFQL
jgi:hypothetical protein